MNTAVAIARRELAEKRFVLVAAVAFAVLAVIVPFMPGVHAVERRNAVIIVSAIFSAGFGLGLSAVLGASIVGRDLSDGRLSFYLSRPVAAPSIWFGKLAAAWILILASFLIVGAPAAIAGLPSRLVGWANDPRTLILAILAIAVVLFFASHVIGTMVRSKSAWVGIDFVIAVVCGLVIWLLARTLLEGGAIHLGEVTGQVVGGMLVLSVIGAGAWQLWAGRIDRRRSHFEMSRFLWAAFAVVLLLAGGFVGWVVMASPADIIAADSSARQAHNGPWSVISGRMRGRDDYHGSFLYNIRDGSFVRIGGGGMAAFSRDGRTAAWLRSMEIHVQHLDGGPPIDTGLQFPFYEGLQLSDDGSRLAIISGNLNVYDISRDHLLGSARVHGPRDRIERFYFASPDVIRMYVRNHELPWSEAMHQPLRIVEYDMVAKTVRETGRIEHDVSFIHPTSGDGLRILASSSPVSLELRDARTGSAVASMGARFGEFRSWLFLHDGRIVATESGGGRGLLRLFSAAGALERDVEIPFPVARLTSEAAGNRLALLVSRDRPAKEWMTALVSLDDGKMEHLNQMVPVRDWYYDDPRAAADPQKEFLCRADGRLVIWDTATNATRVLN